MKLTFGIPNMCQAKALVSGWELGIDGAEQTKMAKWAEKMGYEMISVPEHHIIPRAHVELSGPHYFDAYTGMAYFAGATETIRVNSCIALLPTRHPIITAKALSTMDWLSGGRVTVTFAVGWLEEEFDLLGVDFHQRGAMAEEYTQAIIELWTKENPEFGGKYVSFRDVAFEPKPVQSPHIPIWFGGDADAVLKRIARYADGWWPFLTKPDKIGERIDFIKSQPDYNGRLKDVFYSMGTLKIGEGHVVTDDPAAAGSRSKNEIVDQLGWLSDQGVNWSSVPGPEFTDVQQYYDFAQWVAEDIMPAVA
jgi:probable F420-dependent oxidoreductase